MNVIELALRAYAERTAQQAASADDWAEQARADFLDEARKSAAVNVSEIAENLTWCYVTEGLPDQVEEARALLAPGRLEYLRYRVDAAAETAALELVQPRAADRISPVTSLMHLGQLLEQAQPPIEGAGGGQQRGPCTAVDQAVDHAARVADLLRRLREQHPDADLVSTTVSIFGQQAGDGDAHLHLTARSLGALRTVVAALGAQVTVRTSGGHGLVLEHGTATCSIDGIDVHLTAFDPMPDDRAAAWLKDQDDAAETGHAGDGEG